jgi:hypothetical protein
VAVREATKVGTTQLGAPGWVVLPSEPPSGTSLAQQVSSGPEKISKKFHCVWTPFGIDFLRSKKQAKNSNWHWVIRLRRIYNFWLFHANILQLSYTFGKILYYFWD